MLLSLQRHAEALLDIRVRLARAIGTMEDSTSQEHLWRCLEPLDLALDELLPSLDPHWAVTEYIENRWSPADIPNSPADWTDLEPPSDPADRRSQDW